LIVLTDLTETRELQARVAQLQRLSALGKMMASLAHQIRTPLSGAMLYAQNLQNQKLKPEARVQFSQKLVNRLQDLEQQVNDLLLFARAGREQQVSAMSLTQLMLDVQNACEPLLQQHQAALNMQLPSPDLQLLGNHVALVGALSNLVQNALQHSQAPITLSAELDADPNTVVIVVEDRGNGVPEHLRQQIFEPFYTTRTSGTGLGLAVVQAVVNSHQGAVRCVQAQPHGARFEIRLPIYTAPATMQRQQEC
jgi:two-component system sensor histidine kinase FlrB